MTGADRLEAETGAMPFPIKIATWNVNGLRARSSQLLEWLQVEQPDIVCLQEIKAAPEQIPPEVRDAAGYTSYWHGAKGYSGVGLLVASRLGQPVFSHPEFDFENRVVAADVGDIRVHSVYVPNGGKDFFAKIQFLEALDSYLSELAENSRLAVLGGDLNVARADQDVHPKERKGLAIGQLPQERELLERLLARGYGDVQRALHPDDTDMFTWWAPWRKMRERNIGWRIDYLLATAALAGRATSCVSQRLVGSSDHAPVVAVFS